MRIPGIGRVRAIGRAIRGAVRRRSARGIVLLYHRVAGPRFDPMLLDVSPANFDAQLAVLCESATVLPLGEFEALRRRGALPARAAAITFDDGYADNLHAAAPLLERHGLDATFFVTSGMVGSTREFWWDDLERVTASPAALPAPVPLAGVPWTAEREGTPLGSPWSFVSRGAQPARATLYLALFGVIRPMPPSTRDAAMTALRAWAQVPDDARESHRTLTAAELRELAGRPRVMIGAHTVLHPLLPVLDAPAQLREMVGSRHALESALGNSVRALAYPFGMRTDVSAASTRAARAAGFDFAMANEPSAAWRWSSRWRVPRVLVRDWTGDEFRRHLAAWWEA